MARQKPLPDEVRAALESGNPAEAVKLLFRTARGHVAKETKEAWGRHPEPKDAVRDPVDAMERHGQRGTPGLAPGEMPPSRDWIWLVVIVAALIGVGYYHFAA